MRKFHLLAAAAWLALASPAWAGSWDEHAADWAKTLADRASEIVDRMEAPSTLTSAINQAYKFASEQETITDKNWVDEKDLEKVAADTQALDAVKVDVPASMNSREAYERITDGVRDPGTMAAGYEELRRLDGAAAARQADIDRLKDARAKASEAADGYQTVADRAYGLARNSEHLVGDPGIEIASRAAGGSFSLSWLALETELVPALQGRASAAKELVKRYDVAIKAAEKDLAVFNDSKAFVSKVWNSGGISASSFQDPGSLRTAEIERIGRAMKAQNDATLAAAKELRDFAAEVRAHNAAIARFQQFLGMARAGAEAAQAANSGSSSTASAEAPAKSETKPNPASAPNPAPPVKPAPQPRAAPVPPPMQGPDLPPPG